MKQQVDHLPDAVYYLQVGEDQFYGPYQTLSGTQRRIHEYLKHQAEGPGYALGDWDQPVIIECPLDNQQEVDKEGNPTS